MLICKMEFDSRDIFPAIGKPTVMFEHYVWWYLASPGPYSMPPPSHYDNFKTSHKFTKGPLGDGGTPDKKYQWSDKGNFSAWK